MRRTIIALALAAVVGICAGHNEPFWRGMTAALLVLIYCDM